MAAEAMDDVAASYANRAVRSAVVYTREAHPGENYPHHTSMDDKRRMARAFRQHSRLRRQILLDDLQGTAHHAYGLLPNMTWIIGRGGFIHYKAAWTSTADVADALEAILDFHANRAAKQWVPFYSERSAWSARDQVQFNEGLRRNGPQAVANYDRMLKAAGRARSAPSEELGPRVPGNFYKTENESP